MKKMKLIAMTIMMTMIMIINCLPVMAKDFTVKYKEVDVPLITDDNEHLAYQLNSNSSKLLTYNWDMKNTNLTTSYYVFGKTNNVDTEGKKVWINTVFGDSPILKETENDKRFTIGWNTGIIYNNKDYVVPTDVNNYRKTVTTPGNVEENTGLTIKTEFKFRNEGQLLEVIYHVKNTSNSAKQFLLWSGGDTELAGDDGCSVGDLNKGKARGFYLYSTKTADDQYPYARNVQMPIFATDTKVKFWRTDRWTDIRRIYEDESPEDQQAPDYIPKHANSMTQLFSKTPYIATGDATPEDTAALWYWENQKLNANEEKVYSVLIGITNFTENIEDNIARIIEEANIEIEQDTYQFTFNLSNIKDGKTIPPQTVESRGKAQKPETPIHEGNMIFDDWYADPEFRTKFDFENTIITHETVVYGRWKLPPGTVNVVESPNSDNKVKILTPEDEITDMVDLTPEELAAKEDGKDISIYVEINDVSDEISDRDKALLEDKLDNKTEVGTYIDLGLFKKVEDDQNPIITRIDKSNEPIQLSLEIPKDLKNTDPNVERTFKLVKIEDGKLITIDLQEKNGNLIFETDDFSTYALTYVDKNINSNSIIPNTLDGIIIYMLAFAISILGIRFILKNIKKTRRAN